MLRTLKTVLNRRYWSPPRSVTRVLLYVPPWVPRSPADVPAEVAA